MEATSDRASLRCRSVCARTTQQVVDWPNKGHLFDQSMRIVAVKLRIAVLQTCICMNMGFPFRCQTYISLMNGLTLSLHGTHMCIYACMYVCMYACMHLCMYVRMCACMYVYIHIPTEAVPLLWICTSLLVALHRPPHACHQVGCCT
jgi:hypothetical protein